MPNKIPALVRATDVIHRLTVLGLVGVCVVGLCGILFNIYANSDYASWNKEKHKFNQADFEKKSTQGKSEE